jgi:DNA-binding response OmpR family regulator
MKLTINNEVVVLNMMEYFSNKIIILNENEDLSGILHFNESGELNLKKKNKRGFLADGGLIIDKAAYNVYVNGIKLSFPKKEFELLLLLASNPRKVFKRIEILEHIWSRNYKPNDSFQSFYSK